MHIREKRTRAIFEKESRCGLVCKRAATATFCFSESVLSRVNFAVVSQSTLTDDACPTWKQKLFSFPFVISSLYPGKNILFWGLKYTYLFIYISVNQITNALVSEGLKKKKKSLKININKSYLFMFTFSLLFYFYLNVNNLFFFIS